MSSPRTKWTSLQCLYTQKQWSRGGGGGWKGGGPIKIKLFFAATARERDVADIQNLSKLKLQGLSFLGPHHGATKRSSPSSTLPLCL